MQISAKDIASLLRTLSKTASKPHFTSAIIAAAGVGSRMGNSCKTTKQMEELCGLPIIVRTLTVFEKSEYINEIIIVAKSDEIPMYTEFINKYGFKKISAVTEGGNTRQESVLKGFEKISDKSEFVAIHDGARCLVTEEIIEKVMINAYSRGAATAAAKVSDTVKRSNLSGFISETIDRNEVWLAQTPQAFKTEIYRAAAYTALEEGFLATDDNSLVQRVGFQVKLVECNKENIKITTPEDLEYANFILNRR